MSVRFRYRQWDGTQDLSGLDADEVLENLTDDLMNFGDLQHALRNMLQRGLRTPDGTRRQGLRDLLQQLRQQRRQTLDRFDLGSVLDDIAQRLGEILEMERGTLDDRLRQADAARSSAADARGDGEESGDGPEGADGEDGDGAEGAGSPSGAQGTRAGGQPGQRGQSGQRGQPGQPGGLSQEEQFAQMLRNIVEQKQRKLEELPPDPAAQVRALQDYEFMNPEAQAKFQELLDSLKQAMLNTLFKDLSQQIQNMSPEDLQRVKDMIRDLNQMLQQRMQGQEPDFDRFLHQYGDMFGDHPPQSLDELMEQLQQQSAAMQSLLDSMPGDMRSQLMDLLADKLGDPGLQAGLSQLAQNLEALFPTRDLRNQYPFRGDEQLDLQAAMHLMNQMQDMDELERQLERTQYGGDLSDVDADKLEELLGEEARETFDQLRDLLEILETAGYIRRKGDTWELTPRGTRQIGQKALAEIYRNLKNESFGRHKAPEFGRYGELADDTKAFEFGDPFHLHLPRTIMNSLYREGPSVPVRLHPDDFEIYRSETLTQTATVLMLDLSWSMALRGSFQAGKKVALALNNLIRMQYPRDSLYLVGFSAYARELQTEQLPYVKWDETVLGTNMHHALIIAQQLLDRHKLGTRQIIMISDGEPTAHLENGRSYFSYPPSPITIRETLKEVKRCTKKDIVINTFMLDRNYYLKEFVGQIAKLNGGRVFYTTPDQLGEYILVDFVTHRRKSLRGA